MKKIFNVIKNWFLYTILNRPHIETIYLYGSARNKLGKLYYFKDTFEKYYIGNTIMSSNRISRVFISEKVYRESVNKL